MQKSPAMQGLGMKITGRGERIRTSGLYVPNVALTRLSYTPILPRSPMLSSTLQQLSRQL